MVVVLRRFQRLRNRLTSFPYSLAGPDCVSNWVSLRKEIPMKALIESGRSRSVDAFFPFENP